MENLKREFKNDMWESYFKTIRETPYRPNYFREILEERGGIGTAKYLLSTEQPANGLTTLWELERLDLSMEALIVENKKYEVLFTDTELKIAKRRLESLDYNIDKII